MLTGIYNGEIRFREAVDVYESVLFSKLTTLDELYFIRHSEKWMKDLEFSWRLQHRADRTESVFIGCHNGEVLTVPARHREAVYTICLGWFFTEFECAGIALRSYGSASTSQTGRSDVARSGSGRKHRFHWRNSWS